MQRVLIKFMNPNPV